MSQRWAAPPEVLDPGGGDGDKRVALRTATTADQTQLVGLFPHGQPRARRPPRLDRLTVRTRTWTDPLQEVQDQAVNGVVHALRAMRRRSR